MAEASLPAACRVALLELWHHGYQAVAGSSVIKKSAEKSGIAPSVVAFDNRGRDCRRRFVAPEAARRRISSSTPFECGVGPGRRAGNVAAPACVLSAGHACENLAYFKWLGGNARLGRPSY